MKPVTGPHNGIVKPSGEFNIEMKNTYDNLFAYLLDKNQKPISNKGIHCEVKFIRTDTTSTTLSLNHLKRRVLHQQYIHSSFPPAKFISK